MNNEETELKRPSNIKQIGILDDNFKVYIEDYAQTFLKQFAKESGCEERIAVLVGKTYVIDGCRTVFVNGIIKGNFTAEENGKTIFTEKSWEDIREQKKIYFPEAEITGWLYIQPGYGDEVSIYQQNYHQSIFREPSQVMLVCDPIENSQAFYSRFSDDSGETAFRQLGGYIVYYDKNEEMNKYMTDNRTVKIDNERAEAEQKSSDEKLRRAAMRALTEKKQPKKKRIINKENFSEQNKLVNLFGTLSAVLLVICFMMGAGMAKNDNRISKLEKQISSVSESYKYIAQRITEDNAQAVFADDVEKTSNTTMQTAENATQVTTQTQLQNESTTVENENLEYKESNADAENQNAVIAQNKSYFPKKYTVLKGDSLDKISRKIYGDTSMVYAIMQENNIEDINRIQIGDVLTLPEGVSK